MPLPQPTIEYNPQTLGPLDQLGKVVALKNAQQESQVRAEQLKASQLENQQRETALRDQQTVMQTLAQNGGDIGAALPQLAGKVTPQTYMGLAKAHFETREAALKMSNEQLANDKSRNDNLLGLIDQAKQLPPDQYAQAWPGIVQKAAEIKPEVGQHLDPNKPVPQQALDQFQIGLQSHSTIQAQVMKEREDKRAQQAADAAAAKAPYELQKAQAEAAHVGKTPGVDVPFSPAVQRQKVQIAGAEAAAKQNAIWGGSGAPGTGGATGEAYLNSLPPTMKSLVTEIGTGKMALTRLDMLLSRNPQLAAAVSQAFPDFDSSKVKSYTDTYKDFTSGKTSVALNSGGTALGHLKELQELNTDASHIPHTPAWTRYQNKAATVSAELAKFYGDPTIPAINSIKETLTSTLPGNRDAAIKTQAQSMGDKLDAYEQQWQNAAPSRAYQAPLPGISASAKKARAALDDNYAARQGGQQSGGGADPFAQFGGKAR